VLAQPDRLALAQGAGVEHLDAVAAEQRHPQLAALGREGDLLGVGAAAQLAQLVVEQAGGV
jgi:hypothetical protein